jgi:hypothetical protein
MGGEKGFRSKNGEQQNGGVEGDGEGGINICLVQNPLPTIEVSLKILDGKDESADCFFDPLPPKAGLNSVIRKIYSSKRKLNYRAFQSNSIWILKY